MMTERQKRIAEENYHTIDDICESTGVDREEYSDLLSITLCETIINLIPDDNDKIPTNLIDCIIQEMLITIIKSNNKESLLEEFKNHIDTSNTEVLKKMVKAYKEIVSMSKESEVQIINGIMRNSYSQWLQYINREISDTDMELQLLLNDENIDFVRMYPNSYYPREKTESISTKRIRIEYEPEEEEIDFDEIDFTVLKNGHIAFGYDAFMGYYE